MIYKEKFCSDKEYPLSHVQKVLLDDYVVSPYSNNYLSQAVYKINIKLNVEIMRTAWERIIKKYEMLRTSFEYGNTKNPTQCSKNKISCPFIKKNLTNLNNVEKKINDLLKEDESQNFNLNKAPLFRIYFIGLSDNVDYMMFSYHPIILDVFSVQKIVAELLQLCESQIIKNSYAEKYNSYEEYVVWLQNQGESEAKKFWKYYLQREKNFTQLKTKVNKTKKGHDEYNFTVNHEQAKEIKKAVDNFGITVKTLIQGVFSVLLSNITKEKKLIYGVVRKGRGTSLENTYTMIGNFSTVLPSKVEIDEKISIENFLKNLYSEAHKLNKYSYIPLEYIKLWNNIPKDINFGVVYLFQSNFELFDSNIQLLKNIDKPGFPLLIEVIRNKEISIKLKYQTKYFDPPFMENIEEYFFMILRGMLKYSKKSLSILLY